MKLYYRLISVCLLAIPVYNFAQTHPNLMLTAGNIAAVRNGCNSSPLLKKSYLEMKAKADKALAEKMDVPVPKDGAGGYTHEQHKNNSQNILACGIAYQISGDPKYAAYIKTMLLQYAAQYEQWPQHPKKKSNQIPGKIFWQCLNDFVWQVTVIQGYDMAYNAIPAKDRTTIE